MVTTAMILMGGLGTRLRTTVPTLPKVLAPVGGRPFVTRLLDQLSAHRFGRVVLCTGYRGKDVRVALGTSYCGMQLIYSPEPAPLGTGGALRLALDQCGDDTAVLVMNGDSYCEADLNALCAWHLDREAAGTVLLCRVADTSRYGSVVCDAEGQVVRFQEKSASTGAGTINAGIYVLSRRLIEEIPHDRMVSLEREVFPAWIGRGLWALEARAAPFIDIGTPESFAAAEGFFGEIDGTREEGTERT